MESLPWPAITAAGGGWLLFGALAWLVVSKLTKGDLVTRREADAKDADAVRLRGTNDRLLEINGDQTKALGKLSDAFDAFRVAAEEKKKT